MANPYLCLPKVSVSKSNSRPFNAVLAYDDETKVSLYTRDKIFTNGIFDINESYEIDSIGTIFMNQYGIWIYGPCSIVDYD